MVQISSRFIADLKRLADLKRKMDEMDELGKLLKDTVERTITLKYDEGNIVNCKYEMLSDSELKIDRLADSSKNTAVTQYFRKRIINDHRNND